METVEKFLGSSMSTTASSYGSSCKADGVITDQFPAGLRVLVVDDDTTCLRILEQMLKRCYYKVTTCSQATQALSLLRERKGCFDVIISDVHMPDMDGFKLLELVGLEMDLPVIITTCSQATQALSLLRERKGCFDVIISDVHMPDMDGFKLLELVGLEMDLPVIMMSADGRTSAVMRGIKHGACDYLIKPVRFEELKNIWQHVIRKKWNGNKEHEQSGSVEDNDRHKRGSDDVDYASSANEGTDGSWKSQKKRKEAKEEDDEGELENDDPSTSKKPRVVWSVELHQQFVSAVNQLGIDKAVPKRILELMNVPGLTRENVASHLQKFRLYLKRLSGVPQQQGGLPNAFYGPGESPTKGSLGRIDIQALAASGQIPAQTLAALHAEVLGRPTGSLVLPTMDKSVLLQASLQGSKCIPVEHGVTFGQPIVKGQSNISKQFSQPNASVENVSSEFGTWSSNSLGTVGSAGNLVGLNNQNKNMLMQIFQQQRQQQHHQSVLPESIHTINVRPSCLVFPSRSPNNFHTGNSSVPLNQNPNFGSNGVIDCSLLSSQSHNASVGLGQVTDVDIQSSGVLNGYPVPASISPSVSSCSVHADSGMNWQVQNATVNLSASSKLPGLVPYMCDVQGSYSSKLPDQGPDSNLGKGASIPSRIAVEDIELQNLNHGKPCRKNDDGAKQEISLDFTANGKVGMPVIHQFSPGDLMSIYSK